MTLKIVLKNQLLENMPVKNITEIIKNFKIILQILKKKIKF